MVKCMKSLIIIISQIGFLHGFDHMNVQIKILTNNHFQMEGCGYTQKSQWDYLTKGL